MNVVREISRNVKELGYEIGSFGLIEETTVFQDRNRRLQNIRYIVVLKATGERKSVVLNYTSAVLKAQSLHQDEIGYKPFIDATNKSFF